MRAFLFCKQSIQYNPRTVEQVILCMAFEATAYSHGNGTYLCAETITSIHVEMLFFRFLVGYIIPHMTAVEKQQKLTCPKHCSSHLFNIGKNYF